MATSALRGNAPSTTDEGGGAIQRIAVISAYIGTVLMNYLAQAFRLGGTTIGELSDQYEVFFVPAGYVFSIWGVIYTGLAAYIVYQALPAQHDNPRLRSIGWLFVLSCAFNVGWLVAWQYQFVGLSILLMLGILGTLITIYARLRPGYATASWAERITTHWTFRVYLGWITVATIANGTTFLDSIGYSGAPLTPALWAAVMLVIATVIGTFFALRLRDIAYTLVLVWAFVGIYAKFPSMALVGYTALAMVALLATGIVLTAVRSFGNRQQAATA